MRRVRYRFSPEALAYERGPRVGHYLISARGRAAYLILQAIDRGKRGGLGKEVCRLYVLEVERVPRDEALAAESFRQHSIFWDRRARRRPVYLSDLAR